MEYYGAIDQGTTSSRCIGFDNVGNIVDQHQEEFNQYSEKDLSETLSIIRNRDLNCC